MDDDKQIAVSSDSHLLPQVAARAEDMGNVR